MDLTRGDHHIGVFGRTPVFVRKTRPSQKPSFEPLNHHLQPFFAGLQCRLGLLTGGNVAKDNDRADDSLGLDQ